MDSGDGDGDAADDDTEQVPCTTAASRQSPAAYRPRVLYFSVFCWLSLTGGRFAAPFLEDQVQHWTSAQIGLCLALQQVVGSLTGSGAGSAADKLESKRPGRGRALCLVAGIVSGTVLFLLHGVSHILVIEDNDADADADADADNDTDADYDANHGNEIRRHSHSHWSTSTAWHISLRLLYAFSTSFVFPVLDGMTLQYLEQTPGRGTDEFGKERLWGAVSWAVTNLTVAFFLDLAGFTIFYPASVAAAVFVVITLYLYAAGNNNIIAAAAVVEKQILRPAQGHRHERFRKRDSDVMLPNHDEDDGGINGIDSRTGARKEQQLDGIPPVPADTLQMQVLVLKVIGTAYGAAFCLALLALASGQAVVDGLVFLFFERLGSSYSIMGVTVVLTVLFEIPIFHVAPDLLNRYGSGPLLLLAGGCYAVRVLGYSLIPNKHILYVLILEPLHGITYACSTTAAVAFVAQFMPVGYEASGQGLVYLIRGVGSVAGLWLGGWATDVLGARIVYRAGALLVLVGMSLFAGVTRFHAPPQNIQQPHAILSQMDNIDDLELTPTAGVGILARDENDDEAFDDIGTRLRRID
jgi:hypothetical protein